MENFDESRMKKLGMEVELEGRGMNNRAGRREQIIGGAKVTLFLFVRERSLSYVHIVS